MDKYGKSVVSSGRFGQIWENQHGRIWLDWGLHRVYIGLKYAHVYHGMCYLQRFMVPSNNVYDKC